MFYHLNLMSQSELSHWELSHIVEIIGNVYMKLTIISEMQKAYDLGAMDSDFIIGSSSLDLHMNLTDLDISIAFSESEDFIFLDRKSKDANNFWKLFHKLQRPVVLIRTPDGYRSLYKPENTFIIRSIQTNSPQSFHFTGREAFTMLVEIILASVFQQPIQNAIYGDDTKTLQLEHRRILDKNSELIRNNEETNRKLEVISKQLEAIQQNQIYEKNDQISNQNRITYYTFLQDQQKTIAERFEKQLQNTPMIIQDFVLQQTTNN